MKHKINAKQVRLAASGRWLDLFPLIDSRLAGACGAAGKAVPCPLGTGSRDGFRIPLKGAIDGFAYHNQLASNELSDGFKVLMWLNDWTFYQALSAVNDAINGNAALMAKPAPTIKQVDYSARRKLFNKWLNDSSETPNNAGVRYLINRGLLDASALRSPALRYIDAIPYLFNGAHIRKPDGGLFTTPAILAGMRTDSAVAGFCIIRIDPEGCKADQAITRALSAEHGQHDYKVASKQIMKITPDINGAAFRLGPVGEVWNVGEGVETMLAVAGALKSESVAAATTATLLERLQVPEHVKCLNIYADKDRNGRGEDAARRLMECESGKRDVKIILPPHPIPEGKKGIDWLDCASSLLDF